MAECPSCHEVNPEAGVACPRCAGFHFVPEESLDDAASDPMIGRVAASKYVILGLINEGGMGAVYRALQMPVEREVAFKVLRTELKDSDNGRDRFIREARAVSRLNHPNIITLYDFGFDNGKHPYMVMEYAPGKSLAQWLKSEEVTTDRVLRVTAQILAALTEAHSHGIVHRDLKPENMIISPKGNDPDRVKLLDFGIARMINEGSTRGITREGEVFGTPHYMAPEQAQGKKDIGPPADVYAIGIMMWEMLCGDCPYDAPTPLAVLFMHINDPLPPLTPRDTVQLVPGLEEIVRKATAKNPMDRYQAASEMVSDIGRVFGSMTGAHPGMMYAGEASQEFVMAETALPGTIPPALDSGTPIPGRAPHFTPASNDFGSGVQVRDPDPSVTGQAYPHLDTVPPEDGRKQKVGLLVGAILVAVLTLAGVIGLSLSNSDADATTDPPNEPTVNNQQPTEPPPAEIAAKDDPPVDVEPIEPTVEPDEPAGDDPELAAVDPDPEVEETVEEVVEEAVEPKPKPKPKPKPEKKPRPEKKTEKPKASDETAKSTEETTTKPKPPAKFIPKPQKFERQ